MVIEQTSHDGVLSTSSRLLNEHNLPRQQHRREVADMVVAQMLHLESDDGQRHQPLYQPRVARMPVWPSMIQCNLSPDVVTTCVGIAMSMGALILAGGAKGKRFALPNAKILIHQLSGGFQGPAADIEIHAKEALDLRKHLDEILAQHTGQSIEKVSQDTDRDYFMTSKEAKEYGLIDDILQHRSTLPQRNNGQWHDRLAATNGCKRCSNPAPGQETDRRTRRIFATSA
jgi:ATP-dependent Clp protease protease subunit